jgi:hypothetical protein
MIQVHLIEGVYLPILACYRCGQIVQSIGSVWWTVDPETALLNRGPFLLHEYCQALFISAWPDATWRSEKLSTFMTQLMAISQVELGS